MSLMTRAKAAADWCVYGSKWLLINLYGPATQDPSVDPVERLKREHGRRPRDK